MASASTVLRPCLSLASVDLLHPAPCPFSVCHLGCDCRVVAVLTRLEVIPEIFLVLLGPTVSLRVLFVPLPKIQTPVSILIPIRVTYDLEPCDLYLEKDPDLLSAV